MKRVKNKFRKKNDKKKMINKKKNLQIQTK